MFGFLPSFSHRTRETVESWRPKGVNDLCGCLFYFFLCLFLMCCVLVSSMVMALDLRIKVALDVEIEKLN